MRSPRPIDPRRRWRAIVALCAVILLLVPARQLRPQSGGGGALLQGLLDAELWATDSASPLLTRNAGRPGAVARLQLWSAVEPWRGLVFFAQGGAEAGTARSESEHVDVYLDQVGIRAARSRALVLEVGKMVHPVGTFASRRFSNRNPLIGAPDGYPVQYPLGVSLSGATSRLDYRVAAISLPVSHEGYVPDPSPRARPAIAAGISPAAGIRVGGSMTWGPYLNDSLPPALLGGRSWTAYQQRVIAVDAQISRGYLETHMELARSRYDVPSSAAVLEGLTYYLEAKYTLSARVYVAARYERNDYPYLQPIGGPSWLARKTNLYDGEAGIGYRLSASRLVKVTYRTDRWRVDPAARAFLRDGRALAMQVSQAFDVAELLTRP